MRRWCARIRPVECVGHAHAFDRFLGDAIHHNRGRDAGGLKECRYDVDYVVELVADAALVLDSGRPGNGHALTRAAKVSCDLLRPLERRVERPGPPDCHVVVRFVGAPGIIELHLFGDRELDTVELKNLARRAVG